MTGRAGATGGIAGGGGGVDMTGRTGAIGAVVGGAVGLSLGVGVGAGVCLRVLVGVGLRWRRSRPVGLGLDRILGRGVYVGRGEDAGRKSLYSVVVQLTFMRLFMLYLFSYVLVEENMQVCGKLVFVVVV